MVVASKPSVVATRKKIPLPTDTKAVFVEARTTTATPHKIVKAESS